MQANLKTSISLSLSPTRSNACNKTASYVKNVQFDIRIYFFVILSYQMSLEQ